MGRQKPTCLHHMLSHPCHSESAHGTLGRPWGLQKYQLPHLWLVSGSQAWGIPKMQQVRRMKLQTNTSTTTPTEGIQWTCWGEESKNKCPHKKEECTNQCRCGQGSGTQGQPSHPHRRAHWDAVIVTWQKANGKGRENEDTRSRSPFGTASM